MAANSNLHAAKAAKNDEFYTRYEDINAEINTMEHGYRPHFKDAVVYCNCDDPEWSNFWKFFKDRFYAFGLKKLISTHYEKDGSSSYMLEFDGTKVSKTELEGNGDFRSEECIELLKQADIVVTNPPFSLFREYVAQLMSHGKNFIILGNSNAITYKEFFPLLKDNSIWLGYNHAKEFFQADGTTKKFGNIQWFTNLDIPKRHEPLKLGQCYYGYEDRYPKYDNYDAINVDKVAEIPGDYNGVMGVPITFLDKYCPEQFEIIALGNSRENFTPNKDYINPKKHTKDGKTLSGGAINCVLALKTETAPTNMVYYTSDNSKILVPPYARILVHRKKGSTQ